MKDYSILRISDDQYSATAPSSFYYLMRVLLQRPQMRPVTRPHPVQIFSCAQRPLCAALRAQLERREALEGAHRLAQGRYVEKIPSQVM